MTRGIGKLFAEKKAERVGVRPEGVTAEHTQQARKLFKRVTTGAGPGGEAVTPVAGSDSGPQAATAPPPRVIPTANPSVVAEAPLAQEKVAEDVEVDWGEDPLALVVGESDEGLLGEKVAGDAPVDTYQSDEPHPLRLFEKLAADFDRLEWAVWEPEALWHAISIVSGRAPSEVVKNVIGALSTLVESEAFWNEHHVFLWTAAALNGQVPDFASLPDLTPAEVTFAVGVAAAVRDAEDLQLPDGSTIPGVVFGDQVLATIAAIFHMAGLVYAPAPLEGANEYLAKVHDQSARGLAAEVEAEWGKMDDGVPIDLEETPLGLQLARLIDIREYVRDPYA